MDWERIHERFMKDEVPVRLAGLAADLARVSSSARSAREPASVLRWVEEGQRFIEWTAGEIDPEIGAELVSIQVMLALWRKVWKNGIPDITQRMLLATQAGQWSERIFALSTK
jgi:hypothetical protein